MGGFIESLLPYFKKYGLETIFITVAIIIALFSFLGFQNQQTIQKPVIAQKEIISIPLASNCFIDISGAVQKPNVYMLPCNKRLKDIVQLAGGLTEEADKPFIARNYNFARYIFDQEKIHIPYTWEINEAIFSENKKTIDYTSPQIQEQSKENNTQLSLETASAEELEVLPGVGKITAQKIVDNKPYASINDLVTKKVVNKTVFEKIKQYITE